MKLQQEKHELELEVQDAQWRVDQGQPPNVRMPCRVLLCTTFGNEPHRARLLQEEAELEWERLVREATYRQNVEEQQAQQQAVPTDAFAPAQITRTTAEPRPNAYIPDDIGIPKPYGTFCLARRSLCFANPPFLTVFVRTGALAPFKPSASGRGLSHMRVPKPQPVEI